jgi:ferritin-like metal-binding protein YciE
MEDKMNIETLKDLYIAELQEARSVEEQLSEALPKMKEAASAEDLKRALDDHMRETRSQLDRVDAILQRHGAEAQAHSDQSMQTIVAEADKWAGMVDDPACRDAGLIASAQRIEHYEIAIYGTLATWAKQLELEEDAQTLHAILAEEKSADETLTGLAKGEVNTEAAV